MVITCYNLTNVTRLYLSKIYIYSGGNTLQKEGFIHLTKTSFPNVKSIYLANNQIRDLNNIPLDNWKNIENVSTLSFSNFLFI